MSKVVIADIVRTPWGKPCGSMEKFLSSDLGAAALKLLLKRTGIAPEKVDQVVFGQAHPSTFPNNIGHFAWLKAELPVEVPGYTVQSNTVSSLQALRNAYYLIAGGNEDVVIAGGADSYSTAPFVMRDVRNHFKPSDRWVLDSLDEAECCTQPEPMSRLEQYIASYGETQTEAQKTFAGESRKKAAGFASSCAEAIASVSYTDRKKGEIVISNDEWLFDPCDEALAPYADGAAVAMLLSEEKAKEFGVSTLATVEGFASAASDVKKPELAGVAAVEKLLKAQGKTMADIAVLEIIENSAADVEAVEKALGATAKVNPLGGALAYGKNDGAEGIAMVQRLVASLQKGEYGIACIYSAGGLGMAALIRKN